MDASERIAQPGRREPLDALGMRARAAERADIEGRAAQRGDQRRVVELRIVRQRDDGGLGIDADLRDRLVGPQRNHADPRQTLPGGEGAARIDHRHLVAHHCRHRCQRLGDVHRADHDHARRRCVAAHEQRLVVLAQRPAPVAAQALARFVDLLGSERQLARHVVMVDQRLQPIGQPRDQRHRALGGPVGEHPLEQLRLHAMRST